MMCGGDVRDRAGQRVSVGELIDKATAEVGAQEAGEARSTVVAGAVAAAFASVSGLGCLHMGRVIDRRGAVHHMARMHRVIHLDGRGLRGALHLAVPLINGARQRRRRNGGDQAGNDESTEEIHREPQFLTLRCHLQPRPRLA